MKDNLKRKTSESDKNISRIFFQKTILSWFKDNGRKYPWRVEEDPYRIIVAEFMLQRTRVGQVLPVYRRFIKKFPSIEFLSDAKVEEIAVFVSKLGLFWRSKMMKEAAKYVITFFHGRIPSDRNALLMIPGVGDYIADAMISFAFGGNRIVIDSNVIRLVTRFFGIESKGEMRRNRSFINFCQSLSENLSFKEIKQINFGLIDHSAAICKPVPLCDQCPLSKECHHFKERRLIDKQ